MLLPQLQEHAACSSLPFSIVLTAVPGQLRERHEREAGHQGREKAVRSRAKPSFLMKSSGIHAHTWSQERISAGCGDKIDMQRSDVCAAALSL